MILGAVVATVARAGIPYLPLTGPPALRMLAMKSSKPLSAMTITTSTQVTATDTNCPDIKPFNTNTTETVVNSAGGYGPNYTGPIAMGPDNPLDVPNGTSMFPLPSPDGLGITPQILATYFQPLVLETNGMAVPAPFRIGFIPPFAQPDKSSHAEYIVK